MILVLFIDFLHFSCVLRITSDFAHKAKVSENALSLFYSVGSIGAPLNLKFTQSRARLGKSLIIILIYLKIHVLIYNYV